MTNLPEIHTPFVLLPRLPFSEMYQSPSQAIKFDYDYTKQGKITLLSCNIFTCCCLSLAICTSSLHGHMFSRVPLNFASYQPRHVLSILSLIPKVILPSPAPLRLKRLNDSTDGLSTPSALTRRPASAASLSALRRCACSSRSCSLVPAARPPNPTTHPKGRVHCISYYTQ